MLQQSAWTILRTVARTVALRNPSRGFAAATGRYVGIEIEEKDPSRVNEPITDFKERHPEIPPLGGASSAKEMKEQVERKAHEEFREDLVDSTTARESREMWKHTNLSGYNTPPEDSKTPPGQQHKPTTV